MILGIYGIGGVGREVLDIAIAVNKLKHIWQEIIFIDDNKAGQSVHGIGTYTFGDISTKYDAKKIEISIAVGEPETKRILFEKVKKNGYKLADVIHPDAYIAESSIHGKGLIMREGSKISCDCRVGENVCFENYAILGHDGVLGNNCQISTFSAIAGNSVVEDNVYIGLGAVIKEGTHIGKYVIVGMGSCVLKNIPENAVVLGNPARQVGFNDSRKVFK